MDRPTLLIRRLLAFAHDGSPYNMTPRECKEATDYIEALEAERDSLQRMLDRITEQNNRTATEAVRIKRASETLRILIYAWLLQDANKHN